ncbi:MAG: hypothetical protein EHM64_00375 [Ignavibacteriae bacterium]|nr:MAG: hypothetical protein EHM64_00375 [Ignavibacteriota bacterium]
MTSEKNTITREAEGPSKIKENGMGAGVYGMAFIGAAVYFIQHAATFWEGVLGVIKALFWPAVLIYKLLEFLKM